MFHTISTIIKKYPKTIYIALDIPMFILTFAFIVITGNRMDPESLALFNSGLGIFTVFTTIGNAMQTVIARRIAAAHKIVGFRDFVLVSLMLTIVTCSPFFLPLHTLPNLKSIQYSGTVPFIVLLSANMAICVCRGILQGTERFYALWFAQAIEHILRLVVLYLYMGEHISLDDAWFTAMIGGIGHLVLGIVLIPPSIYRTFFDRTDTQIGMKKEIFAVIMSNFFLNFLLSCDVIIAGERLGELGGGYVTANKFGRLLYFVGSSVVVVILPFLARAKSTPEIQRKIVWGTFASIPIFGLFSPLISWISHRSASFVCITFLDHVFQFCSHRNSTVHYMAHSPTISRTQLDIGLLFYASFFYIVSHSCARSCHHSNHHNYRMDRNNYFGFFFQPQHILVRILPSIVFDMFCVQFCCTTIVVFILCKVVLCSGNIQKNIVLK
jgi:hypothetical protein